MGNYYQLKLIFGKLYIGRISQTREEEIGYDLKPAGASRIPEAGEETGGDGSWMVYYSRQRRSKILSMNY